MELLINEITDPYLRENFKRLQELARVKNPLNGFVQIEFSVPSATAHHKVRHGLGYVPKDVLITFLEGFPVTFNYSAFDKDSIDVTTSGASRVRALIGSYQAAGGGS